MFQWVSVGFYERFEASWGLPRAFQGVFMGVSAGLRAIRKLKKPRGFRGSRRFRGSQRNFEGRFRVLSRNSLNHGKGPLSPLLCP